MVIRSQPVDQYKSVILKSNTLLSRPHFDILVVRFIPCYNRTDHRHNSERHKGALSTENGYYLYLFEQKNITAIFLKQYSPKMLCIMLLKLSYNDHAFKEWKPQYEWVQLFDSHVFMVTDLNKHWCSTNSWTTTESQLPSIFHVLDTEERDFPVHSFMSFFSVSLWEECHSSEMSAGCQSRRERSMGKENPETGPRQTREASVSGSYHQSS